MINQSDPSVIVPMARRSIARPAQTFSFAAGTRIHTDGGMRPIEQIAVGDLVLSQPEGGVSVASSAWCVPSATTTRP